LTPIKDRSRAFAQIPPIHDGIASPDAPAMAALLEAPMHRHPARFDSAPKRPSFRRIVVSAAWLAAVLLGALLLPGGCDRPESGGATPNVGSSEAVSAIPMTPEAPLVSLSVSPDAPVLSVGDTMWLTVKGVRSDGSVLERTAMSQWSVQGDPIGTFGAAGELTATAPGVAVVTARDAGTGLQASALVTVTGGELVQVRISADSTTVALGLPLQLKALGVLDDGSSVDLSGVVSWSTEQGGIVGVGAGGALLGLGLGTALVTAADPATGLRGQISVQVTPAVLQAIDVIAGSVSLPLGLGEQLQAIGHLSDGTTVDVTQAVSWSSGDAGVASITSGGGLTVLGVGRTLLVASDSASGIQGSAPFEATAAVLQWLEVTPAQSAVLLGLLTPLVATGHYSDGSSVDLTRTVQWRSDDPLIAAVISTGSVLGVALGSAGIHASDLASGQSGAATVSVLGGLAGL
jgi:Bacterial Ig-like domain (group 2)